MENFKVFLILQRVKISLGSLFLSSSFFFFKAMQPIVILPGESHGQRSLAGSSPCGHKESDTTEAT